MENGHEPVKQISAQPTSRGTRAGCYHCEQGESSSATISRHLPHLWYRFLCFNPHSLDTFLCQN